MAGHGGTNGSATDLFHRIHSLCARKSLYPRAAASNTAINFEIKAFGSPFR